MLSFDYRRCHPCWEGFGSTVLEALACVAGGAARAIESTWADTAQGTDGHRDACSLGN